MRDRTAELCFPGSFVCVARKRVSEGPFSDTKRRTEGAVYVRPLSLRMEKEETVKQETAFVVCYASFVLQGETAKLETAFVAWYAPS